MKDVPTFREQVGHLAQGAEQLGQHDFHRLCKALLGTANWLVEKPARHSEVMGMELATGYSELVDPIIQRERFEAQARAAAAGDDEAMALDEDFLAAMEYAMPPTTGTGMGIDRLLMVLTGLSIRETVLFPIVRRHGN